LRNPLNFHECAKSYKLWGAVEKDLSYSTIISEGLQGKRTVWRWQAPNWELDGFDCHGTEKGYEDLENHIVGTPKK
jgi:hypothetical protein